MPTALEQLIALVPPSQNFVSLDWAETESELGQLPDDYKAILDTYGGGTFFGQINLWAPKPAVHNIITLGLEAVEGFLAWTRDSISEGSDPELARLPDGTLRPVDFGPSPALPPYLGWGSGEQFRGFWHCTGSDPNTWPVLCGELMYWDYQLDGLAEYLVGIGTGTRESNCFSPGLPPRFDPD